MKKRRISKIIVLAASLVLMLSFGVISCFAWDQQVTFVPATFVTNQNFIFKLGNLADGQYQITCDGAYSMRCFGSGGVAATVSLASSDVAIFTMSGGKATVVSVGDTVYNTYTDYDFMAGSGRTVVFDSYTPPDPFGNLLSDVEATGDSFIRVGQTVLNFVLTNPICLLGLASWLLCLAVLFISKFWKN